MDKAEWERLYGFMRAKRDRPFGPSYGGKRLVKGRAKAVGQILKRSRVHSIGILECNT